MSGKYLLDTNIIIAMFTGDLLISDNISKSKVIFIPVIVIGELLYGAIKSGRPEQNVARINGFASENQILSCDEDTARWYGQIKNSLRKKGCPIPENDIWIAAIALQYNLMLVSRDEHFGRIENLKRQKW